MKKIILASIVSTALLGSSAFAGQDNGKVQSLLTHLTPGVTVIFEPSALKVPGNNLKKAIANELPTKGYAVSNSSQDGSEIQYRIDNKTIVSCARSAANRVVVCAAAAKAKKAAAMASSAIASSDNTEV